MSNLTNLESDLKYLKLNATYELLQKGLEDNSINSNTIEFIQKMYKLEKDSKSESAAERIMKTSNFPHRKTVDDYDFTFQPSVSEDRIRMLHNLGFIDKCGNIVLVCTPGVGKHIFQQA